MVLRDPDRDPSNESVVSYLSPEEASKVDLAASFDGVKLVARQSKSLRLFLFDPEQGRRDSSSKATLILTRNLAKFRERFSNLTVEPPPAARRQLRQPRRVRKGKWRFRDSGRGREGGPRGKDGGFEADIVKHK